MSTRVKFSRSVVPEGRSLRVRIRAPRRLGGERVHWTISGEGIRGNDFSGSGLKGTVRLDRRGRATLRLKARADYRQEGRETARFELFPRRDSNKPLASGRFAIEDRGRLKIMPMGDSITFGFGAEAQSGYRGPRRNQLSSRSYQAEFVGGFSSSLRHWGRFGWLIAGERDPITGEAYAALRQGSEQRQPFRNGINQDVRRAISRDYFTRKGSDRNVLLLMIGTNDFLNQVVARRYGAVTSGDRGNDAGGEQQNRLAASNRQRLDGLLRQINRSARAEKLELDVVVGTIPTQRGNPFGIPTSDTTRTQVRQFNRWIRRSLD
ncbi:MAG: SGNH/GDSL hydrolase family protein, partial [Prochlorococcaceae cyanobacterium]